MDSSKSTFILDTSVLIHDPEALRNFRDTAVVIPIFVVMELDDLKTNPRHEVSSSARTASRRLVALMDHGSLHDPEGVLDPETNTRVYVVGNEKGPMESLRESASSRKMDLLILGVALSMQERFKDRKTVLVSKDVNLRILADSAGLKAEDYDRDRVPASEITSGVRCVEEYPQEVLRDAYAEGPKDHQVYALRDGEFLQYNEFLQVGTKTPQVFRYTGKGRLVPVPKGFKSLTITPRNLEQRMALDLLLDPTVQFVTLLGMAGTGKSFLALAACLALLDQGVYDRIILSKPVVAMGRDIGFLPGTEAEKLQPWMLSFFDNLDQLFAPVTGESSARKGVKEKNWEHLIHSKKIEIQPLHSIRGRSIAKAIMLVDEGQNMTPHEVKTVVSRAAAGTKVIMCGDPHQIDDAYLDAYTNGLVNASVATRGSSIAGTVTLTEGVRSPLSELAATKL